MKEAIGKLVLRISMGGFMLTHGWPKLSKLISTGEFKFGDPLGIGPEASLIGTILAEFFCSILIIVGVKTKLATIPLIFTMLVAAFIVHADDPFGNKEKALLYLAGYVAILLLGPGRYSLDHRLRQ